MFYSQFAEDFAKLVSCIEFYEDELIFLSGLALPLAVYALSFLLFFSNCVI